MATDWGTTAITSSTYGVNWTRLIGGDFAATSNNRLDSISIYCSTTHNDQVRVALYQGGTTSNPTNATLVEDLGKTSGTDTGAWVTVLSKTNPILTASDPTWIAVKGYNGQFDFRGQGTFPSGSDFYSGFGRWNISAMGTDRNVAFPTTVPSGGTSGSYWYSWKLTYSTDSQDPRITGIESSIFSNRETGVVIDGFYFGATQGNGKVYIGSDSVYSSSHLVEQTVNSWSNTQINIDLDLGLLNEGRVYVFVVDNSSTASAPFTIEVGRTKYFGIKSPADSNFGVNWWRDMSGLSPNIDNMKLKGVSIYCGSTHTAQVRLGVYEGGTSSDPNGATLKKDFGQTSGSATNTWITLTTTDDISLTKNTMWWIAVKGTGSGFNMVATSTNPSRHEFQTTTGRFITYGTGQDPSVAYVSSHPATTSTSAFWYVCYLHYAIENTPVVENVSDEDIFHSEEQVFIRGYAFGSNTGSAKVELNTAANGSGSQQDQTIESWSDTLIIITVNRGSLSYGTLYIRVRDSDSNWSNGYSVNVFLKHKIDRNNALDNSMSNSDSVTLYGSNFSATQGGTEKVQLSDTPDGSGTNVDQTVTSWGDTEITFTCVKGALTAGNRTWLTVIRDESGSGDSSARRSDGFEITLTT